MPGVGGAFRILSDFRELVEHVFIKFSRRQYNRCFLVSLRRQLNGGQMCERILLIKKVHYNLLEIQNKLKSLNVK